MKNNYEITSLVGNTPLIRLTNIEKIYRTSCKIYAKVESFNLTGSIKEICSILNRIYFVC